ncbi:MAG TPA: glycoside hydrolase domain-containing protein [Solirubrobacteraceae bacterium]|nr:glycoside hydrolase domain-containing protein [Solirubrobacteraceae bacterium]
MRVVLARHGLEVTATWNRDRAVIRRALGHGASAGRVASSAAVAPRAVPASAGRSLPRAGTVFTGLGVDTCSAPSSAQMSAWNASPYRALGVYIGGANMACSQPNLTAAWVGQQWAAGWHLIPTYVGLQAPSNSCGCASIVPGQAGAEGTAAASDAVTQAQAVGIGAGAPIYFDMEGYSRTAADTSAVLTFLSAWTTQLHAEGYASGVYSSGASGIQDLVSQYGTGYPEPDDIWVADWNGSPDTSDPYLPSGDWAAHQRLHQYQGAHNETYGGVTINVDSDALDGGTASGVPAPPPSPSLRVSPAGDGTARLFASWPHAVGVVAWRTLGGASPTALQPFVQTPSAGAVTAIAASSAFPYYAVQALGSGGQVLGSSAPVATPAHLAIYGHSAFVPARGLVGIPVGCFTGRPCRISLMVYVGHKRIARSGPEQLSSAGGLLFFKLSAPDRKLLAQAPGRRLAVTVAARDASGVTSSRPMNLTPFLTTGSGPRRSLHQTSTLRIMGVNDFVYRRAVGGILAACSGPTPCLVKTTITAAHRTIASTGVEFLGANQIGYLSFRLAPFGRALLARAAGNQLGARVTVTDGHSTARGSIALSSFS